MLTVWSFVYSSLVVFELGAIIALLYLIIRSLDPEEHKDKD